MNTQRSKTTVLLIAALSIAAVSYASISASERGTQLVPADIQLGSHTVFIVSGAKCHGQITTTLIDNQNLTLESRGNLQVKLGKRMGTAQIETRAYFNPLGQLFESKSSVTFDDIKIELSTTNVQPIYSSVVVTGIQVLIEPKFELSGPISLGRHTPNSFRISLPHLQLQKSAAWNSFGYGIFSRLKIEFSKADFGPQPCDTNNFRPLVLDSLVQETPFLGALLQ